MNIILFSCSPVPAPSNGQPTLASLPMIGSDNDDFALSTPMMPLVSSTPAITISPPTQLPNTKSTTLESDSSSSSSSSDSSSDYETETTPVPTATNGKYIVIKKFLLMFFYNKDLLKIYLTKLHFN